MSESNGKLVTLGRLVYGTSLRRTLVRSLILAALCLVTFKFLFIPVRVDGGSMSPTYSDRGINLVNRMAYKRSAPRRGDVVAIWIGENSHSVVLMKRIVGLPGEAIGFQDGRVTVNGVLQDEPYVSYYSDWNCKPVVCGPNEYFFVGDNRSMPIEDHFYGRAAAKLIAGKMLL
jgi:signal peptidase I